jgi:hypothetical protein
MAARHVLATTLAFLAVNAVLAPPAHAGGLPLLGDKVDPSLLPRPFGVNFTFYHQNQGYEVKSLEFSVPGITLDPAVLGVENTLEEKNVKADIWLFPFLDIFALFGQIDATTRVDFSGANLPVALNQVNIRYDGDVYGGGLTLAAGGERWFGSLTGIYTSTNLGSNFNSDVTAWVVSPRLGLHQERASFWVGATYQRAQETHSGHLPIPVFGEVDFAVKLRESSPWNLQVGMQAEIADHWYLEIEGGAFERVSSSVGLSYRF